MVLVTSWLLLGVGCGPNDPPNVILISIDTLRADHVGASGYGAPTTTHVDRLARDSIVYRNAIAHAPTTLASHASILTSMLPTQHGASIARQSSLSAQVPTLAEVLAAEGYATASLNGGIQLDPIYGLDRGFDVYESVQPSDAAAQALEGPENRTSAVVAKAKTWIAGVQQPFFLFLHSYEIHHPYTPEPRHLAAVSEPYAGSLPDAIGMKHIRRIERGRLSLDDADRRHIIATYDAEIRSADEALGELFGFLREKGLYEDTLIVFTSDHGEEFGEHGHMAWHSHSLFDELLRVPLIVKLPAAERAGEVVEAQVRGIDVAPTVLAVAGLDAPPAFLGRDLREIDGGVPGAPAVSVFDGHLVSPRWSVRTDDWKLIVESNGGAQLYELTSDAGELRDVSGAHPTRVAELERLGRLQLDARPVRAGIAIDPDDDLVEALRALGYVE